MASLWCLKVLLILVSGLAAATGYGYDDHQIYRLPRLFHLDDYDRCVASRGVYCVGSFLLRPSRDTYNATSQQLYDFMLRYSSGEHNFNRTLLHRGYCVTSRCSHLIGDAGGFSPSRTFARCVDEHARQQYGLEAVLSKLEYCETPRTRTEHAQLDTADIMFAALIGVLVLANVVGTAYDFLRDPDKKPNYYLLAWSLKTNWHRLTATYDGDPRLSALKAVQGIRAFCLAWVMLAHTLMAHHMAYIYNPEYIERGNDYWLSILFHNGTVLVQTFFLLSSFLLAYNLILYAEKQKIKPSIKMLPQCILHRVIRILPLHLFVVGLTATWFVHLGSGPQWTPLMRGHAAACRRKWWTHALFINNLVQPDDKCIMQTWFLAADMQIYILCAALTLLLYRRSNVLRLLGTLVFASALLVSAIAYYFDFKPLMMFMNPEVIRSAYAGIPSFMWLYSSPWGSLPTALLGVFLAFLHYNLRGRTKRLQNNKVFMWCYRMFFPCLILWMMLGECMRGAGRGGVAGYAAGDRGGFALIVAVGVIGIFNNVDGMWKRFFEWSGWLPLGRMSLAVLLLHWHYNLQHLALQTQPSRVSIYQVGSHWHSVQFMSYVTALPLHLGVELPTQRILQRLFFGK